MRFIRYNTAKKSLFLLAGAPCSGKNTLLDSLCTRGEPIFGDYFDFQRHHLKHVRQGDIPFDILVRGNYWFPGRYLKEILALEAKPKTSVMHIDILGVLLFEKSPLSYWEEVCTDETAIVQKYESVFRPLIDQYDDVCINTLDVELSELCRRYRVRQRVKFLLGNAEVSRKNLVGMEQASKGWIYKSILNSWMSIFRKSHEIIRLRTTWSGSQMNIQKLD